MIDTIFMLQGLDELQSVHLLQCYLQEDYRGTRDSLKVSALLEFHFLIYFSFHVQIIFLTSSCISYIYIYNIALCSIADTSY